jgi:hypothetical protein
MENPLSYGARAKRFFKFFLNLGVLTAKKAVLMGITPSLPK